MRRFGASCLLALVIIGAFGTAAAAPEMHRRPKAETVMPGGIVFDTDDVDTSRVEIRP